jgi:hypothetical protein
VSAPIVATQSKYVVDLSLDASLATKEELDATNAQLLTTKNNINSLFASSEALSGEVDVLAADVAGKQGLLTPGTVAGGHQLLQGTTVRAITGAGPVKVAADTNHVEVWLEQSELAATPAIAALQTAVGTKQSQLFAGEVTGGHRLLLQPELFVGDGFDEGAPDEPLPGDTVRALKVSSPLVATSDNSAVHLSLDPGWSPYFCAGRVNANATIASSIGRVGFSVFRVATFPVGVYQILFDTPAPNNDYVITIVQQSNGNIKIWDATLYDGPPTAARFHVVSYSQSWQLMDSVFHFSVVI